MANPLPKPTINNDFGAGGSKKAGHPINPSTSETQVLEQVMKE
jgi:hypothetical protein